MAQIGHLYSPAFEMLTKAGQRIVEEANYPYPCLALSLLSPTLSAMKEE